MKHLFNGTVFILISLVVVLNDGKIKAQDIQALQPAAYTIFDIENGLPFNCVLSVFTDDMGRVFVNSCDINFESSSRIYQFDGNRSYATTLPTPEAGPDNTLWTISGVTSSNALYGHDEKRKRCFYISPDRESKSIYPLDEGEKVYSVLAGDHNTVYALTANKDRYHLYRLDQGILSPLVEIKRSWDYEVQNNWDTPVIFDDQTIWFVDGREGFVRIDLQSLVARSFSWESLLGTTFRTQSAEEPLPTMMIDAFGKPIFHIPELNEFYTFDPVSEQLNVHTKLNSLRSFLGLQPDRWAKFYRDQRGNTLIAAINIERNQLGGLQYSLPTVLLTGDGQVFDYSLIANLVTHGRFQNEIAFSFHSEDFKKEVLISSSNGLIAVELHIDLGIETLLPGKAFRGIAELGPSQFLAIDDGGVAFLIDESGSTNKFNFGPALASRSISSFSKLVQFENKLWFTTSKGELISFDPETRSAERYDVGHRFDMFQFTDKHRIVFASFSGKVYDFDLQNEVAVPRMVNGIEIDLGDNPTGCIILQDRSICFASDNGLWSIAEDGSEVRHWGEKDGFTDMRIKCVTEASDGKIWAGSQSAGLYILDPDSGELLIRNKSHGLSNSTVVGILEDNDGFIWASTFGGITVFNPAGDALFDLSERDGLSHREFNRFSFLKSSDDRLLFGSISGISVLDPKKIRESYASRLSPHLYLSRIAWHDKRSSRDSEMHQENNLFDRIKIPAAHRTIDIEFGLSKYASVGNNNFFYTYSNQQSSSETGEQIQWTNIGNTTQLNLTDLPTGEFEILVKGISSNGQKAAEILHIPVDVQEFFYKTWWFYLACISPLLLIGFMWIRRLMTERERLEAEVEKRTREIRSDKELIQQQAESLAKLDEAKTRIYTNISHEFRTPLTVIRGTTDLLEQNDDKKTILRRNADRLLNLVNQLLELSKLESGHMTLHFVHADIVAIVRDIFESFIPIAENKDIGMHFYARPTALEMDLDFEAVHRICSNLLSNALKFTPSGGDIYVEITQPEQNGDEREPLTISVRDTGVGIPEDKIKDVFNRFYQVDDSTTRVGEGTGIGLSLTRELLEYLGGTIAVFSTPGEGSEFVVRLPVSHKAEPIDDPAIPGFRNTPVLAYAAPPATIDLLEDGDSALPLVLVVEDNPDVLHYIISCLRGLYRIEMAMDGQEGFEKAIQTIPDIIVSDVMMPVKDGIQMCDELKHAEPTSHVPVVMLTAKADIASRIEGLERGADAYITKPFEKEELLLTIKNLIAAREAIRQRYAGLVTPSASEDPNIKLEDIFVNKLNEMIDGHLDDEDFGVIQLSRAMGYSRSQLHKKVKALTGHSPSGYLQRRRMHHARSLLRNPENNVSEVAYAVGFRDPSYFARVFRREFDISPTDFTHQHGETSSDA